MPLESTLPGDQPASAEADHDGDGDASSDSETSADASGTPGAVNLDDDVESTARSLGAAIADLPAYRAFESARSAVEDDEELQERIAAFERQRREFAVDRQTGDATQEDVDELRRAQENLHSHPVMAEFLESRERLQERLEAVNRTISAELAVDFGEEAGGCCQD